MIDVTPDKMNSNITPVVPARVIGTPFQPSVARPVFVTYTIQLSVTSTLLGTAVRAIELRVANSNPPPTAVATTRNQLTGVVATNSQTVQLSYIVPKGYWVNLVSVGSSGTGSITLVNQSEIPL